MSHSIRSAVRIFERSALGLLVALVLVGCGGGGSGTNAAPSTPTNTPTNASTNTPTTPSSTNNVDDDPALLPYVCTSNLATTPGKLKLLPVGTTGKAQIRGYAEYVPPSYASSSKWPCIINLHGDGEFGDGSSEAVLKTFTYSCLPGMISQDNWDSQHRFVVLSPQFTSYGDRTAANVNTFIQYAKANYKIDVKRIYLTGVSGGGVALGNYLTTYSGGEAAAAIPVSCYVPPIGSAAKWKSVPVWLLCGSADTTVGPANVLKVYTTLMAAVPPPTVTPRITLYTGVGHDGNSANKSYAPASMDNTFETTYGGVDLVPYSNIYDWMLQYHR
jgi:predicted peptidase